MADTLDDMAKQLPWALHALKASTCRNHIAAAKRATYSQAMKILRTWLAALVLLPAAPAAGEQGVDVRSQIEADGTSTLIHEVLIQADPAAVWAAISTSEGWMEWAVPRAWTSPDQQNVMETSYDQAGIPGSPDNIRQLFLARIPERILAFRTIQTPQNFPFGADYLKVTSVFELTPEDGATHVRLTSTGYPDSDAGRALLTFFEQGNAEALISLKERFVSGPIDWSAGADDQ